MIEPQEETASGWVRRAGAGGRVSVPSTMTGVEYAMKAAGMALSYHQVGALIGVSGRQAARYADMARIPEWTAREIERIEREFLRLADRMAEGNDPVAFPSAVPEGMPETSFLAAAWRADRIMRDRWNSVLQLSQDAQE